MSQRSELAEQVVALAEQVARLTERVAAMEEALREAAPQPPVAGPATGPATGPEPAIEPEPATEEFGEELLLVISAAVAAYLGKKPHIRQIRLVRSPTWTHQGRVTIQASHALALYSRSGA